VKAGCWRSFLTEAGRLDLALYRAVARTRTPALDAVLVRLSRAADYSRISIGVATLLAVAGGPRGRRAAVRGMASVGATAAIVNVLVKPLARRRRPERGPSIVAARRRVAIPASRSFPSGHTAAAFAFAAGAGRELPLMAPPLYALAALVGYSRVHTGVHYPLDVIVGALCGIGFAELTGVYIDRFERRPDEVATAGRRDP
jgi:membrane-associated phospholipid phosphatase